MVLLLGMNFADQLLVKKALQSIYGIGAHTSTTILAKYSIHPWAKMRSLSAPLLTNMSTYLETLEIENVRRRKMQDDIKRLRDMGSYRGRRHAMRLPVRGQRTRNQISTARRLNILERRA